MSALANNRFTVNISWTYDVSDDELTEHYNTLDLGEAAGIDENNYRTMPYIIGEEIDARYGELDNYNVTVRASKVEDE